MDTKAKQFKDEVLAASFSAVSLFQAWRDTYSDEAWDKLHEDKQMENLLDALCELEYQVESNNS